MNTVHTEQRSGTARSPVSSVRRLPSGLASPRTSALSVQGTPRAPRPSRRRLSLSPCPARPPLLGGGAGAVGGARAVNGALGRRRGTSSRNFLRLGQLLGQLLGRLEERQPRRRPTQRTISRRSHLLDPVVLRVRRAKCHGLSDHWDEASYQPRGLLLTGPPRGPLDLPFAPFCDTGLPFDATSYCRHALLKRDQCLSPMPIKTTRAPARSPGDRSIALDKKACGVTTCY